MTSALPALPQRELVLDRYRPLRPLGSGGSGSVWLARDEHTGLDVALKIVPREGKAALRAEREAEAAARLRHERCLRAYGFGSDAGHVYIAYEYVGGRTLRDAIRAGELSDRDAVEAAAQILDGLAHAHRRGIVHRDVKPSNVLLAEEERLSVRLLDFGLAQFDRAETLTAAGDVPGTLAYISPERLRGAEACTASDVWAVGIVLWEALARRHPFSHVPLPQMAPAIEAGPPPLADLRPDLPKRILAAVERALDPEPGRRPSAAALAAELREVASGRRRSRTRAGRGRPRRRLPRNGLSLSLLARTAPLPVPRVQPLELVAPGLAGVFALAGGLVLPFYPAHWPVALAALAAAVTAWTPRLGVALALAVPVLPLGNVALGLALLWIVLAAGWLALTWRDPRGAFASLAGPLLAPLGLLALVPLAAQAARGHAHRAGQAAAAVGLAAVAAGVRGADLPLGLGAALGPGLADADDPLAAARALVLATPPELVLTAVVLAAAAVAVPFARGPWRAAFLAAGLLAGSVLAAPGAAVVPLVAAAWLTYAAAAAGPEAWLRLRAKTGH